MDNWEIADDPIRGDGELQHGGGTLPVTYSVTIVRCFKKNARGDTMTLPPRVGAEVVSDHHSLTVLFNSRARLTLVLSDGRRLPCMLHDAPRHGSAELTATGKFD